MVGLKLKGLIYKGLFLCLQFEEREPCALASTRAPLSKYPTNKNWYKLSLPLFNSNISQRVSLSTLLQEQFLLSLMDLFFIYIYFKIFFKGVIGIGSCFLGFLGWQIFWLLIEFFFFFKNVSDIRIFSYKVLNFHRKLQPG